MNQGYFTYYEAYDAEGRVVANGNGSFEVDGVIATARNVLEHAEWLLEDVKENSPAVVRVVIKQLTRL